MDASGPEGAAGERFKLVVLGRYEARLKGNESHVTVNVLAGSAGHLTQCGTLTMSEAEWARLVEGLRAGLGADVEIEDSIDPV